MQRLDSDMLKRMRLILTVAGSLVFLIWSCDVPNNSPFQNTLPDTRLANIPANDTIGRNIDQGVIPEQTLYWAADDPDGYIVGYRFRWIDMHRGNPDTTPWTTLLNLTNIAGSPLDSFITVHPMSPSVFRVYNFFATIRSTDADLISRLQDQLGTGRYFAVPYTSGPIEGDSVKGADPVQVEAPNKGTFIFDSPADSNRHRFEVKGIDNSDADDPTPATVYFWTRRSPGPVVFFSGGPTLAYPPFVIRCPTQRNVGLTFTFAGYDASTNDREYSWTVDDSTMGWSPWSVDPRAIVTAANLLATGTDTHTAYVRGRNRWGVVSATAARRFRAVAPAIDEPNWPTRILVFNNTRDSNYTTMPSGAISAPAIESFYSDILDSLGFAGRYDFYNRRRGGNTFGFIERMVLSRYALVIIATENRISIPFGGARWQMEGDKQDSLREYLNYGGKMIWSGSPSIKTFFGGGGYARFASEIFHTAAEGPVTPFREDPGPNFIGARGRSGYPDMTLDPAKVPPDSLGLRYISVHYPRGFGETVLEWQHRLGDPLYQGAPLAVRYLAPPPSTGPFCRQTYSVVYFGFPLFYVEKSQAIQAVRKALQDLNLN